MTIGYSTRSYMMNHKMSILIILFICLVSVAGSIAEPAGGQNITTPLKVKVGDILSYPEKYSGITLFVDGKVTSQCGSGCWFIISDDTGDLYVNLKPNNFVIPPSMGKNVEVNGTIIEQNGDVAYIGSSVSVEGIYYP